LQQRRQRMAIHAAGEVVAHQTEGLLAGKLIFTQQTKELVNVGNRGCVQIFTGALEKLAPMRGWLNIFNTTFTLHLREESVDE
ncbi:hemin-degrading factor, partial [Klebsiella pneumoniae]|nr:hemin-degrading factor [Klebsiella pneumoniae]